MRGILPASAYGAPHGNTGAWFGRLASQTAQLTGKPATFLLATLVVVIWAVTGPFFGYRHLAAGYQYGHHDRNLPHGLFDSKYANARHDGASAQIRRAHYGDQGSQK
jgi:hypothetical protein